MDKKFEKILRSIGYGTDLHTVWNDFILLTATTIANAVDFNQERENEAVNVIKKYKEEDVDRFVRLFVRTVTELERNPNQDYLGEIFMRLGLGNNHMGQFFTPYNVARMMVDMNFGELSSAPYESVNDPACGSGVMLIAAINRLKTLRRNPALDVLVVGQDINTTIALMCYIQISLLGAAGYVLIGNSLTRPLSGDVLFAPKDAWCTPMYFHKVWHYRRMLRIMDRYLETEVEANEKQHETEGDE